MAMKNRVSFVGLFACILPIMLMACSPQINPTPTPAVATLEPVVDYKALSEEALAALIDETIFDLATAVATPNKEIHTIQSEIERTQAQIAVYTMRYGEIAGETILSLQEIEAGLAETANRITRQSLSATEFEELGVVVTAVESQAAAWLTAVTTHIAEREQLYANTLPQPGQVAYNRVDAFSQAHDFLDALNAALVDDQFTPSELAEISQLAATAEASLSNTGDPQLISHARQIDDLARHVFRGDWPQASDGAFTLKFSLPVRPQQ
jgi:hypothetical protein